MSEEQINETFSMFGDNLFNVRFIDGRTIPKKVWTKEELAAREEEIQKCGILAMMFSPVPIDIRIDIGRYLPKAQRFFFYNGDCGMNGADTLRIKNRNLDEEVANLEPITVANCDALFDGTYVYRKDGFVYLGENVRKDGRLVTLDVIVNPEFNAFDEKGTPIVDSEKYVSISECKFVGKIRGGGHILYQRDKNAVGIFSDASLSARTSFTALSDNFDMPLPELSELYKAFGADNVRGEREQLCAKLSVLNSIEFFERFDLFPSDDKLKKLSVLELRERLYSNETRYKENPFGFARLGF